VENTLSHEKVLVTPPPIHDVQLRILRSPFQRAQVICAVAVRPSKGTGPHRWRPAGPLSPCGSPCHFSMPSHASPSPSPYAGPLHACPSSDQILAFGGAAVKIQHPNPRRGGSYRSTALNKWKCKNINFSFSSSFKPKTNWLRRHGCLEITPASSRCLFRQLTVIPTRRDVSPPPLRSPARPNQTT
jgi:hypothetical protein